MCLLHVLRGEQQPWIPFYCKVPAPPSTPDMKVVQGCPENRAWKRMELLGCHTSHLFAARLPKSCVLGSSYTTRCLCTQPPFSSASWVSGLPGLTSPAPPSAGDITLSGLGFGLPGIVHAFQIFVVPQYTLGETQPPWDVALFALAAFTPNPNPSQLWRIIASLCFDSRAFLSTLPQGWLP